MRYYVVPPVGTWTTGDIIHGPRLQVAQTETPGVRSSRRSRPPKLPTGSRKRRASKVATSWYVVMLTPICDFVPARIKAEFVVLWECVLLRETQEYKAWAESPLGDEEALSETREGCQKAPWGPDGQQAAATGFRAETSIFLRHGRCLT